MPEFANAAQVIYSSRAHSYAPKVIQTVSEWADANRILSKKGSAEPGPWRTDRNPPLREPMDCFSATSDVKEVVLKFPIQSGKALSIDTPIPTPKGWTLMGELKVGDFVFDEKGKKVKINFISEVFKNHDCFKITFSDGSKIISDSDHNWSVIDLKTRGEARKENARRDSTGLKSYSNRKEFNSKTENHKMILSTKSLSETLKINGRQSRYAIPISKPLNLSKKELPIDPYLFGLWLGDGHSHYAAITTMDIDIIDAFKDFDPKPHTHQSAGLATTYGIRNNFNKLLRELGVLGNKHIPKIYLRSSIKQRKELLCGLLDTDGYANKKGIVEISSSKPELAECIIELIHSLGFKTSVKLKKTKSKDAYRISFSACRKDDVFKLQRKLSSLPESLSNRGFEMPKLRYITDIENIESVPTKCISVDSEQHLFLAGKAMIPTHNTEIAINTLGYFMCNGSGPVMVALPAEVSMQKWINQKLNPLIEETPAVSATLTTTNTRNSANQKDFKDFYGGQLYLEHAGSPARLKSTSVKFLIVDELTEFAANLQTGDDPLSLLEDRTSAFPATFRRLYISSPGIKGMCRTDDLYEKSDQRVYKMPCPHCQALIAFEWSGLVWDEGGSNVRYVCEECASEIDEHHKTSMMRAGQWVPKKPGRKIRGYYLGCLYYQIGLGPRWADLVEQWLEIHNDLARLKSFINSRLALVWEDPAMRKVQVNVIAERAEAYNLRLIPDGVGMLTAGVDTQDNRLECQIVGWGQGMAAWTIDYKVLEGDPADQKVWDDLTEYINTPIIHENGHIFYVQCTAIDAGGHRTEAVKDYVRQKRIKRPMVIFGAISNNAPVLSKPKAQDINWKGVLNKKGVHIQHVGTVAIKNMLFGRLATDGDKEQHERMVHFSDQLPDSFFKGITSEVFDPRKNRFILKRGQRNEQLDTFCYAYAATHNKELRLHLYTRAQWDELLLKYSIKSLDKPIIRVQNAHSTGRISLSGWKR